MATALVWAVTIYALLGLLFAVAFVAVGVTRVDAAAQGTGWGFRLLILPGVEKWSAEELTALAEVARSKGGRRESDYVRLLDGHKKLRAALRKLAAATKVE